MIDILDWDTRTFGFMVARAQWSGTPSELDSIVMKAQLADVTLLYFFGPPDAEITKHTAIPATCVFRSGRVDFHKRMKRKPLPHFPTRQRIRAVPANFSGLDDICQLGIEAGCYSRFFRDPVFPRRSAELLYRLWTENSIRGILADATFAYAGQDGHVAGFITAKKGQGGARVGLVAVAPHLRGQGIGKALLDSVEDWACREGITDIYVSTQAENKAACGLYSRCGYAVSREEAVFHLWLRQPPEERR